MTPREARLRPPANSAVRLIDLPGRVNGLIAEDEDGFVNIYLNARRSRAAQAEALQHELRHYYRDDLHSGRDIRAVESEDTLARRVTGVRQALLDACRVCDVVQRPPRIPIEALKALASGLEPGHFTPMEGGLRVHREDGGTLDGAVYLNAQGLPDGATLLLRAAGETVTVDLGPGLALREIWREPEGLGRERVY